MASCCGSMGLRALCDLLAKHISPMDVGGHSGGKSRNADRKWFSLAGAVRFDPKRPLNRFTCLDRWNLVVPCSTH